MSVSLSRLGLAEFEALAGEWDALVGERDGPFLTSAWLAAWWRAFASEDGLALVLSDGDRLLAGGCFREPRGAVLASATNAHSNDWGIVCRDRAAARSFWQGVAALGRRRLALGPVLSDSLGAPAARDALGAAGYRVAEEAREPSPWLELPASRDALLAERSRNLRSQVGRRRRALEREGELALRTVRGGPTLERDLDAFFELEAAGWKGGEGTAIALDPALLELYRGFARRAAAAGMLRLYLLELDGGLVAADYGCAFGGCGYLVKTAFDEDLGRFAPGLVLRAAVLESSIEEGLSRYDFLGGPDPYKLRWAEELRPRSALRAFRGIGAAPAYAWWASLRPALKSARGRLRGRTRVAR
jgi:CelD/BcsL family acetyltransferase involved in cellulose biosynthesis